MPRVDNDLADAAGDPSLPRGQGDAEHLDGCARRKRRCVDAIADHHQQPAQSRRRRLSISPGRPSPQWPAKCPDQ